MLQNTNYKQDYAVDYAKDMFTRGTAKKRSLASEEE